MTTEIILFGNAIRGDFFLVILLLFLVTATIVVVTLLRKGRRKTSKTELETLLSNPEVIKAFNSGNEGQPFQGSTYTCVTDRYYR